MPAHRERHAAFAAGYLTSLRESIRKNPLFTVNNLNRDFVGTRGFSVVFRRPALARVHAAFPVFQPFLDAVLRPDCNAFYLNPLQLEGGSRVDPHIDRSLHAYCLDIDPPLEVSVLYVEVPETMRGGELVLQRGRKHVGRIRPAAGLLVTFDGDLLHSVSRLDSAGRRLSLVCEQYLLDEDELGQVPEYAVESRARTY
jgi:hypothetical protein